MNDDKITFTFTDTHDSVENELLKLAISAGVERLTVQWSLTDIPHKFDTGESRRYLEGTSMELGPKATRFPELINVEPPSLADKGGE